MLEPLEPPSDFDPLAEFPGRWDTGLTGGYSRLGRRRRVRNSYLVGHLTAGPSASPERSHAQGELYTLLRDPARRTGRVPYLRVRVHFGPGTWVEPDLAVLERPPADDLWVPPSEVVLPVEFVSTGGEHVADQTRFAEAGVPWYLRVDIDRSRRSAYVRLDRLQNGRYAEHAAAHAGQRFRTTEPFDLAFDPADLLEPGSLP